MENQNKNWSDEDKSYLKDNYNVLEIAEICSTLQRNMNAVRWMASELGLTKEVKYWQKWEQQYLAENITSKTIQEIALYLDRSVGSVNNKLNQLRIGRRMLPAPKNDVIEKDVPFFKGKSGEYRALLAALRVGESFVYPNEDRQTVQNQVIYYRDKHFRTKIEDDKTRRIWRLL